MRKYLFVALALLLAACEKPVLEDGNENTSEKEANVILRVTQYEQLAFGDDATRAADIADWCSRLNVTIFDAGGTKVKAVAQKEGDASFGTIALSLGVGTYQLVVIAHSCDGTATISSVDKVTFPNNKVTDTFYYYGELVVTDGTQSHDIALKRAVAMFRMVLTDSEIPSNVAKMKFYYVGGSSTFSPVAGYGCVNSKQTEIREVEPGVTTFDIYTMPHTESDVLTKLTVTALDAADNTVEEIIFEDVPVTRNKITRYTGRFFSNGMSGKPAEGTVRFTLSPEWDGEDDYSF